MSDTVRRSSRSWPLHLHDTASAIIAGIFVFGMIVLFIISPAPTAFLAGRVTGSLISPLGALVAGAALLYGHIAYGAALSLGFALLMTIGAIQIEDRLGLPPSQPIPMLGFYALCAFTVFTVIRSAFFVGGRRGRR